MKPVSSNVKPNTKRGPPASATLLKATKKNIIANDDDDDDINNYDFEENEPSYLDDSDADTVPDEDDVQGETSQGRRLSLEMMKTNSILGVEPKAQVIQFLGWLEVGLRLLDLWMPSRYRM